VLRKHPLPREKGRAKKEVPKIKWEKNIFCCCGAGGRKSHTLTFNGLPLKSAVELARRERGGAGLN